MSMLSLPEPKSTHQLTTFDRSTRNKTIPVRRGERTTIATFEGTGYLARLWMTFPGWFWQHWAPDRPISPTILKTLILRITVDNASEPQVVAPVGDFFGVGLGEVANFTSLTFAMSSGGFTCSWPMPFRCRIHIEVENLDEVVDTEIFCNALIQEVEALPDPVPTFHAFFHTATNPGPEPIEIVNVEGAGKYVGCTLACQGEKLNYLSFLEAPEHVSIDDDVTPRIVGTGLEDYFLGGWYFREGTFAGPHHGVPVKDALRSSVAMYRVHELDAITFRDRLKFNFETPWEPDRLQPFWASSVAFLYLQKPQGAPEIPDRRKLLGWFRTRDVDHQSLP